VKWLSLYRIRYTGLRVSPSDNLGLKFWNGGKARRA
jgi:hypothetical protein